MIVTSNNVLGGGDIWAQNADGTTQVKTLAANNTSVAFTGVPYGDYGYMLFVDTANAATANTAPPKRTVELPSITSISGGTCTVTYTISKVTAAQAGAKCYLRIFR